MNPRTISCFMLMLIAGSTTAGEASEISIIPVPTTFSHQGKYVTASGTVLKYGTAGTASVNVEVNGPKGSTASFSGNWQSINGNANGQSSLAVSTANGGSLSGGGTTTYSSADGSGTHSGGASGTSSSGQSFGWTNATSFNQSGFTSTVATQNNGSYTITGTKGSGITVTPL